MQLHQQRVFTRITLSCAVVASGGALTACTAEVMASAAPQFLQGSIVARR
jgi:hypothetical protein